MIIVQLRGGLGNQIASYFFARWLCKKYNTELWLDASSYRGKEYLRWFTKLYRRKEHIRKFELAFFNIHFQRIYNNDEFADPIIRSKLGLKSIPEEKRSNTPQGWRQVVDLGDNLLLDGYWYVDFFFEKEFENMMRTEIRIKKKISDYNYRKIEERISLSDNAVSVHIRRGDYRDAPHIYAVCGQQYYQQAFKIIEQKTLNPQYFIFSDEIDWVKANLQFLRNAQFVHTQSNISDFELMRRCHHNIIANSTYSWWAAYLNENQNKTIITPAKWFTDEFLQTQHENLTNLPPAWLII